MTKEIRFGLVGYGLFGSHHARAIDALPGAHLAAIAVKSEQSRATARQAHPQTAVLSDYRELAGRDDVDVVDVVVPNSLHFDVGMAALSAGKHLLMEKPMAVSLLCSQPESSPRLPGLRSLSRLSNSRARKNSPRSMSASFSGRPSP